MSEGTTTVKLGKARHVRVKVNGEDMVFTLDASGLAIRRKRGHRRLSKRLNFAQLVDLTKGQLPLL